MLGYLLTLIAAAGTAIAGWIDLKTTEIPDGIPTVMAGLALAIHGGVALLTGNWMTLGMSILVGALFFAFGFGMYYTGQWGGGDAKLLSAVGFLLPTLPTEFAPQLVFPFALSYLLNVFMIGAAYIITYAFAVGFTNQLVVKSFMKDLHAEAKHIVAFGVLLAAVTLLIPTIVAMQTGFATTATLYLVPGGLGLFVLWRFLKTVEKVGFTKNISTKNLREGDMIGENMKALRLDKKIIRGLTKEEVAKIKKAKSHIWIREGVRFGPVFFIALLVTLFYGDVLFALL